MRTTVPRKGSHIRGGNVCALSRSPSWLGFSSLGPILSHKSSSLFYQPNPMSTETDFVCLLHHFCKKTKPNNQLFEPGLLAGDAKSLTCKASEWSWPAFSLILILHLLEASFSYNKTPEEFREYRIPSLIQVIFKWLKGFRIYIQWYSLQLLHFGKALVTTAEENRQQILSSM